MYHKILTYLLMHCFVCYNIAYTDYTKIEWLVLHYLVNNYFMEVNFFSSILFYAPNYLSL